jgi:hypothetical protein
LHPLTAFVEHFVLDIVAFDSQYFLLKLFAFSVELLLVHHLSLLSDFHLGCLSFQGVIGNLLLSFGSTDHTEEDHLFFTHGLDLFASKDSSDVALDGFTGLSFFDLLRSFNVFALLDLLTDDLLLLILLDNLSDLLDTVNTLTATFIRLDQADSHVQVHIDSEDIVNYFHHLIRLLHL